jgi:hypothetical protein
MENNLVYKYGKDNIFDFSFMEDFTTVLAFEEDGNKIANLVYQDKDDFYCYSEKKTYTEDELLEKFNIEKVA